MTVIAGYGHHGIICGGCGGTYTCIETADPVEVDGQPVAAVLVRCWEGHSALFPADDERVVRAQRGGR